MENTTNVPPQDVFKIVSSRLVEFKIKLHRLNKKAAKLGCPETTYSIIGEETHYVDQYGASMPDPTKFGGVILDVYDEPRECHKTTLICVQIISGGIPTYNGWEFLGKVEKLNAGIILSSPPGKEIPESYRNVIPHCEHCKLKRNRKFTYIVKHESGELKQVGHQCIRDFLGHQSPEHIARMCEFMVSLRNGMDEYSVGGKGLRGRHVRDVVTMSVAVSRLFGWVSKQNEYKTPTSSKVYSQLYARKDMRSEDKVRPTAADCELAYEIISWLRGDLNTDGNGYLTNLKTVSAEDFILDRHVGLVISSYIAYDKAIGDPLKFKSTVANTKNEHFGTVKKRENFDLKVVEVREMSSDFGTTTLIKFTDQEDRLAVWFASGRKEVAVGEILKVKATVKKHDEYKGLRQTILTRVSVISGAAI